MNFGEFGTWILLVVIILGVEIQIVKLTQRVEKLEGQPKK